MTFEDYVEYEKKWGLYFDNIREQIPGFLVDNLEDMLKFVESVSLGKDDFYEAREKFKNDFGIKEFESSKLITEFIKENLNKNGKQ